MESGGVEGVKIEEVCIPCNGEGKLGQFSNSNLVHPCPWCGAKGKVDKEVNEAFVRVQRVMPVIGMMCTAFGTWSHNPDRKRF